jgi:hypothetical protein
MTTFVVPAKRDHPTEILGETIIISAKKPKIGTEHVPKSVETAKGSKNGKNKTIVSTFNEINANGMKSLDDMLDLVEPISSGKEVKLLSASTSFEKDANPLAQAQVLTLANLSPNQNRSINTSVIVDNSTECITRISSSPKATFTHQTAQTAAQGTRFKDRKAQEEGRKVSIFAMTPTYMKMDQVVSLY